MSDSSNPYRVFLDLLWSCYETIPRCDHWIFQSLFDFFFSQPENANENPVFEAASSPPPVLLFRRDGTYSARSLASLFREREKTDMSVLMLRPRTVLKEDEDGTIRLIFAGKSYAHMAPGSVLLHVEKETSEDLLTILATIERDPDEFILNAHSCPVCGYDNDDTHDAKYCLQERWGRIVERK